ncbi:hypothetical protein [Streptomyces sp. L2]|uniref:hypothetical protein n=1 Tax=Streptomyces sp. L2 TaxID=2162665 RepID=UPI0013E992DA|nr:hypothetical protein [Streptomyces sp. L2]
MSDTSTTQPLSAGSSDVDGHGRHRGPVAAQDDESSPRGRHRKPADDKAEAAV